MRIDIKELRNKTGMSQREFAAQYGIPLSTLRKWEQGEAKPATYVVNLIADKLQDKLEYQITIDKEQAAKERIRDLIVLQKDLRSNGMRVLEALDRLKESASRIVAKSELFFRSNDAEQQEDCLDIVTARIDDFVWHFIDIVLYIRKADGSYNGKDTFLQYCITSYNELVKSQSEEEKQFLGEIQLFKEIMYDYFNRELYHKKLIALMQNCAGGAVDVYSQLAALCKERGLIDKYMDKNS